MINQNRSLMQNNYKNAKKKRILGFGMSRIFYENEDKLGNELPDGKQLPLLQHGDNIRRIQLRYQLV